MRYLHGICYTCLNPLSPKNSKNSDNGRDSQCNAVKFFEKSDTSPLPLFEAQVKYEKNKIMKFNFF